jgi:hypothetical protein
MKSALRRPITLLSESLKALTIQHVLERVLMAAEIDVPLRRSNLKRSRPSSQWLYRRRLVERPLRAGSVRGILRVALDTPEAPSCAPETPVNAGRPGGSIRARWRLHVPVTGPLQAVRGIAAQVHIGRDAFNGARRSS